MKQLKSNNGKIRFNSVNLVKDKHLMKVVLFDIKDFCNSVAQDLLNKALNFASEHIYILKCDVDVIHHASTPGLRNKEVCLMCQWMLMMELKCASSQSNIC